MGELDRDGHRIHAKLVYYGAAGAGKSANAEYVAHKLKKEHRGELRREQRDGVTYDSLRVSLGMVQGYQTTIDIYTVPGALGAQELRGELLEGADGVVFVADARPERHKATLESFEELREHLQSYGRSFDDVMLLIQYNRRDLANENDLDALHRRLGVAPAATFEAVANEGIGVLQTLTTASKLMLGQIRRLATSGSEPASRVLRDVGEADVQGAIDAALPRVEVDVQPGSSKGFRVDSAGPAEGTEDGVRLPIRLLDESSGRRFELVLSLSIDSA